jgi:hypothetical protein
MHYVENSSILAPGCRFLVVVVVVVVAVAFLSRRRRSGPSVAQARIFEQV